MIFRITFIDKRRQERTGWNHCDSMFKGAAWSDEIKGVLDEAS